MKTLHHSHFFFGVPAGLLAVAVAIAVARVKLASPRKQPPSQLVGNLSRRGKR